MHTCPWAQRAHGGSHDTPTRRVPTPSRLARRRPRAAARCPRAAGPGTPVHAPSAGPPGGLCLVSPDDLLAACAGGGREPSPSWEVLCRCGRRLAGEREAAPRLAVHGYTPVSGRTREKG